MRRCLLLVITAGSLLSLPFSLLALPRWADLGLGVQTTLDPNQETQTGYMFALGGKLEGPMTLTTHYDPKTQIWYLTLVSDFYKNIASYNHLGQTNDSITEIYNAAYARQLGFANRHIHLRGNEFQIEFFEEGKVGTQKRIGVDPAMLDTDFLLFELSALIQKKPANFNTDILLKTRAWRINVDVLYFPPNAKEIVAITKQLPDKYQALLAKFSQGFHCFAMKPTGFLGLLSPTAFYFIYANVPGSPFLGYWGGNGLDLEGLILNLAKP